MYSIVQNSSKGLTESSETTVVKKQRVENQKSETYKLSRMFRKNQTQIQKMAAGFSSGF